MVYLGIEKMLKKREIKMLEYAVLYQSETGNTRKIAAEIFSAIPSDFKDLINICECRQIPDAKIYFVGFGVCKGTCSRKIIDCLSQLSDKKIVLFATCGAKPLEEYRKLVESNVTAWIEDDNEYIGMFMCQGKMRMEVRKKYEESRTPENLFHINKMLENFDEAMLHPNKEDLERVRQFTLETLKQMETVSCSNRRFLF